MKQVLPTYTLVKKTTVIYLGDKKALETQTVPQSVDRSSLQVVRMQNAPSTVQWLKKKLQDPRNGAKSFAIMCDYNYLKSENFQFLDVIKADKDLCNLPFFVHTDNPFVLNRTEAIQRGIDDCVYAPIDWQEVQKRIDFWTKHKANIRVSNLTKEVKHPAVHWTKRIFDIVGASCLILALSPLLIGTAIAIRLDSSGPIIYRSKRIGKGYQKFDFLKFRSMYKDADQRLKDLIHLNQYQDSDDDCFIKIKNDPRITRVGKFIRKTSMDELPQLFNVLFGEMSLVGNRPLPVYEAELMVRNNWAERFLAPAGITGLWQVTKRGKNDMSTSERVALDIRYARENSFWYDIKLLLKTFTAVIQEEDV